MDLWPFWIWKMAGIASLKTRFNILFWLDRNCIAVSKPSKRHYKVRWRLAGERDPTTSVASQLLFGLIPLKTIISTYDLKYRDIMTMIYTDMHIDGSVVYNKSMMSDILDIQWYMIYRYMHTTINHYRQWLMYRWQTTRVYHYHLQCWRFWKALSVRAFSFHSLMSFEALRR